MRILIISYAVGLILLGLYPLKESRSGLLDNLSAKAKNIAAGEWMSRDLLGEDGVRFQLGGSSSHSVELDEPAKSLAKPSKVVGDSSAKKDWSFWKLGQAKQREIDARDELDSRDRQELRELLGEEAS